MLYGRRWRHLLYSSDRSNATSLWKVPVIDGKAAGAPTLVRKDLGRITNVSLTSSGSLYYTEQTGIVDIYTAKIDLESKKTVDGPRQIISGIPDPISLPTGRETASSSPISRCPVRVADRDDC
jgi:hypothetical protein